MHRPPPSRLAPKRLRVWLIAPACVLLGGLIGLSTAGTKNSTASHAAKSSGGSNVTKQLHLCVNKKTEAVRVVGLKAKCKGSEKSVLLDNRGIGPAGPPGPTGPANTEVVQGPTATLSGDEPTGSIATSTAGCDHAINGANREAYGGGVVIITHPTTGVPDIVATESSYPGVGVTGQVPATAPSAGAGANAYTAVAAISRMFTGDSATVQAYVICGP
jgi:hypothetical protein